MKIFLIILLAIVSVPSCVQKAYKKTAVITLSVPNIKNIKSVVIRGDGKPLSWDSDFEMKEVIKDSLYSATINCVTGYKFAEVKFTVNGDFEMKNKPNRRIEFNNKDTIYYNAVFDSNK